MSDTERPVSFSKLALAARAFGVIRGYSIVGIGLAVALTLISFAAYDSERTRWICRAGAMGCLVTAVVGLNVVDRMMRGRLTPFGLLAGVLGVIAAALIGVGLGALHYNLGAAWSPFIAAMFILALARTLIRLRTGK